MLQVIYRNILYLFKVSCYIINIILLSYRSKIQKYYINAHNNFHGILTLKSLNQIHILTVFLRILSTRKTISNCGHKIIITNELVEFNISNN